MRFGAVGTSYPPHPRAIAHLLRLAASPAFAPHFGDYVDGVRAELDR